MITRGDFETMIMDAISDAGSLHTLGAENGVEIDTSGPQDRNVTTVEGYFRKDGERSYFQALVTVTLLEFEPVWEYDDEGEEEE